MDNPVNFNFGADNNDNRTPEMVQVQTKILDTKGCCFLCLAVVEIKIEEGADHHHEGDEETTRTDQTHINNNSVSLKSLHRYLKIDTGRLPGCPSSLSSSMKKQDDFHAELCESCAKIVKKFSSVFLSFEMIQNEIHFLMEEVHQRIPEGVNDSSELVQNYCRRMTNDKNHRDLFMFIDELRIEIARKCSKLKTDFEAHVKVESTDEEETPNNEPSSSTSTVFLSLNKSSSTITTPPTVTAAQQDDDDGTSTTSQESENEDFKFIIPESEEEAEEDPLEMTEEDVKLSSSTSKSASSSSSSASPVKKRGRPPRPPPPLKTEAYIYNSTNRKYKCTECKLESASTRNALNHYNRVHLKIKLAICEICGAGFSTSEYLKRVHMKKCGSGEGRSTPIVKYKLNPSMGKYNCTKCNKEFPKKDNVNNHYNNVHQKNWKFKCGTCNVSFVRREPFEKHQLTCLEKQENEKLKEIDPRRKWPCPTCGKRFLRKIKVEEHQRLVHLKERNYHCDLCEKRYSNPQSLEDHKTVFHFRKEVNCKYCGKCFPYGKYFKCHERACAKKKKKKVDADEETDAIKST